MNNEKDVKFQMVFTLPQQFCSRCGEAFFVLCMDPNRSLLMIKCPKCGESWFFTVIPRALAEGEMKRRLR